MIPHHEYTSTCLLLPPCPSRQPKRHPRETNRDQKGSPGSPRETKCIQKRPKRDQERPRGAQERPQRDQKGSKSDPRTPQGSPREPKSDHKRPKDAPREAESDPKETQRRAPGRPKRGQERRQEGPGTQEATKGFQTLTQGGPKATNHESHANLMEGLSTFLRIAISLDVYLTFVGTSRTECCEARAPKSLPGARRRTRRFHWPAQ